MNPDDIIYLTLIPKGTLIALKVFSSIISLSLLFGIIFFLKNTTWFKLRYADDINSFISFKQSEAKRIEKIWTKITKRLKSQRESDYKLAVIEAGNLFDEVLTKSGYKGETTEGKIKQMEKDLLPSAQDVLYVTILRNDLLNDPDYRLSEIRAEAMIKIYEKALQELNVF